jgi:hypothetical protein
VYDEQLAFSHRQGRTEQSRPHQRALDGFLAGREAAWRFSESMTGFGKSISDGMIPIRKPGIASAQGLSN